MNPSSPSAEHAALTSSTGSSDDPTVAHAGPASASLVEDLAAFDVRERGCWLIAEPQHVEAHRIDLIEQFLDLSDEEQWAVLIARQPLLADLDERVRAG
jgi:hypothetical protein